MQSSQGKPRRAATMLAALVVAAGLSVVASPLPAIATTVDATDEAAGAPPAQTATYPDTVTSGDFTYSGNVDHTTAGDGNDDGVRWVFDFRSVPLPESLTSAVLTLTLTPQDHLFTNDEISIDRPGYAPFHDPALDGLTYQQQDTIQVDLLARYGSAPILAAIWEGWLPMQYRDDAFVTYARLTLSGPSNPVGSIFALDTNITENFDTLSAGASDSRTPDGWFFAEAGGEANTVYRVDDGNSNVGDTYSYGQVMSFERALGMLQSNASESAIFASYRNDTGETITSLSVGYMGEQWRIGAAGRGADRLDFSYSTDGGQNFTDLDELDFQSVTTEFSPGPIGGNDYRTYRGTTITGLAIAPGQAIVLRWTDYDIPGADDGLAVDDFLLSAHAGGGTPSPCPPGAGASAVQCTSVMVETPPPGELSIWTEQASVEFGTVTGGQVSANTPVGSITYKNTLNNGNAWSTSVAATSLVSGASVIPFTGMTFTPGPQIGDPVTAGPAASFTGTDATPGTSYSDPLTLSTAPATAQGQWTQFGSAASLHVPSGTSAGAHAGTLQYTITG